MNNESTHTPLTHPLHREDDIEAALPPQYEENDFDKILSTSFDLMMGCGLITFGIVTSIYFDVILTVYSIFGLVHLAFGTVGLFGIYLKRENLLFLYVVWKVASIMLGFSVSGTLVYLYCIDVIPNFPFCASRTNPAQCQNYSTLFLISIVQMLMLLTAVLGIIRLRLGFANKRLISVMRYKYNSIGHTKSAKNILTHDHPESAAVIKFNLNPEKGIKALVEAQLIDGSPKEIASFLHRADNLNIIKIGDYISEQKNSEILREYMNQFDFTNKEFDEALRWTLSKFRLPGEAQKIDRVVEAFALRFVENNPEVFPHHDTAYVLAFSVIMLNTDAHNPSIKKKMSKRQFLQNNKGIAVGKDLPSGLMEELYDRVVKNEIKIMGDGILTRAVKQGWLHKLGLNGLWQKRWFVLSNNTLYYYLSPEDNHPRAIIPLVGLTIRRTEEGGYKHCFELLDEQNNHVKAAKFMGSAYKATHQTYVFRTASESELDSWMNELDLNIVGDPISNLVKNRRSQMITNNLENIFPNTGTSAMTDWNNRAGIVQLTPTNAASGPLFRTSSAPALVESPQTMNSSHLNGAGLPQQNSASDLVQQVSSNPSSKETSPNSSSTHLNLQDSPGESWQGRSFFGLRGFRSSPNSSPIGIFGYGLPGRSVQSPVVSR